jgi:hypothetical protein
MHAVGHVSVRRAALHQQQTWMLGYVADLLLPALQVLLMAVDPRHHLPLSITCMQC